MWVTLLLLFTDTIKEPESTQVIYDGCFFSNRKMNYSSSISDLLTFTVNRFRPLSVPFLYGVILLIKYHPSVVFEILQYIILYLHIRILTFRGLSRFYLISCIGVLSLVCLFGNHYNQNIVYKFTLVHYCPTREKTVQGVVENRFSQGK